MDSTDKTSSPPPAYSDPTSDPNYGYDANTQVTQGYQRQTMDSTDRTSSPPPAYSDPTSDPNYGYDANTQVTQGYQNPYSLPPSDHYQIPYNHTVVVSQPQGVISGQGSITHPSQVSSGMGLAICVCLFCCCPIGLAAIIKASSVQDAPSVLEAKARAKAAYNISMASIVCGIILKFLYAAILALKYSRAF